MAGYARPVPTRQGGACLCKARHRRHGVSTYDVARRGRLGDAGPDTAGDARRDQVGHDFAPPDEAPQARHRRKNRSMQHTKAAKQARRQQKIRTKRNIRRKLAAIASLPQQEAICASKQPFLSRASAEAEMARWQWRGLCYPCPICHQWHLASRR